jgi:ribonuclease P protein component
MSISALRVVARRAGDSLRVHTIESVSAENVPVSDDVPAKAVADHRLRKHADYQRVYREGRKQFSSSMSYFFALRPAEPLVAAGPRVGLTVGKVLGKAVDRNRIKRRMRDIVRRRIGLVHANADIILHPRRTVLTIDFAKLESEVVRIFTNIQSMIDQGRKAPKPAPKATPGPETDAQVQP